MGNFYIILFQIFMGGLVSWGILKVFAWGFWLNIILTVLLVLIFPSEDLKGYLQFILAVILPLLFVNTVLFAFTSSQSKEKSLEKYSPRFQLQTGRLRIHNIRRGISIIGSAGSGKTESVVYNLLKHLSQHSFSGIIHDYKDFELSEIAYPLFKKGNIPFFIVSFDQLHHRVNPVAPRYLPNEESVNEVSRVLLENLLEQKEILSSGSTKFFSDAAEGIICGLIWKLKSQYPQFCTLPHLIAIFQFLDTSSLASFLSSNLTSKAMADAFLSGIESERQTAAVKSTLANALKKISTQRIFMALSADEVPLDINNPENPAVVSIVNNPKFENAYSPAIATVIHTIVKQMSVRNRESSFILMEEAPTIRLINMHRIPATLRSYDITTIYVMQDKVQNDLLYGEKGSRSILSNLSYQFFGKVNDPDTAKYYERFFEIVKRHSISTSQSEGLQFDTRVTKSEREVSKIRADLFFRLQPGEFVAFADGKDQIIKFSHAKMEKALPSGSSKYSEEEIAENFEKIHWEARSIFESHSQINDTI